jgi:hypothetical protein
MLSLVSHCSSIFQHHPSAKSFSVSSMFQFNLDLPLNTKCVQNHVIKLLWKIGNFWVPGFYDMNLVHTYQIFTLMLVDVDCYLTCSS